MYCWKEICNKMSSRTPYYADHSVRAVYAWTPFTSSNTGIVGSNHTLGMDVCVRLLFCSFYVYVAALRWDDPRQRSRTDCVQD
jgi:hypothetical protein